MNDKDLVTRAKSGTITDSEVNDIVRALTARDPTRDLYTLIHILAYTKATQHEPLVANFLDFQRDPMVARIALSTLCRHWEMYGKYLDATVRFARGVAWDSENDVRLLALSLLGDAYLTVRRGEALTVLLEVLADSSEEPVLRQAAYFALAVASGKKVTELPPASRLMDLAKDVDPHVVKWAQQTVGES